MRAEVGLAWSMPVHEDAPSAEDIRKYNPLPVPLVTEGSRRRGLIQDQQITLHATPTLATIRLVVEMRAAKDVANLSLL
jgi:hypothetical protein